jgi:hypothetical protein
MLRGSIRRDTNLVKVVQKCLAIRIKIEVVYIVAGDKFTLKTLLCSTQCVYIVDSDMELINTQKRIVCFVLQ